MTDSLAGVPRAPLSGSGLMSRWLLPLLPLIPLPHRAIRGFLARDNQVQNESNGWAHLRQPMELGRYGVIHGYLQHYAPNGSVLDVGCADGILQERVSYGRYTGIDSYAGTIERAQAKADTRTRFVHADAATYVPDEKFDAIVWNECLYYLDEPLEVITRYRAYLRPGGVMIVSMFYQTFATRRLFRKLGARLGPLLVDVRLSSPFGGVWSLRCYDAALRDV